MKGLLIDITKCIGCNACREGCREANGLPEVEGDTLRAGVYTVVQQKADQNVRRVCMHCLDPTCVSVCPVGAFQKNAFGGITYEESRCIGCRYCMLACPFSTPTYEWSSLWPKVSKCHFCPERLAAGKPTACAESCPTGATMFGERDELIAEARKRIAENPGTYVNHIYGLTEVGGTSVLYLSPVAFDQIGFRTDLPQGPLPILTFQVLSKIPQAVGLGMTLLGGIWWITNRRDEVAAAEGNGKGTRAGNKERRS
jgi:formate dehydrogenase iron-sulfur subunit